MPSLLNRPKSWRNRRTFRPAPPCGAGAQNLPELATFANGAMVRYLDFNDTYLAKGTGSSLRQYPQPSSRREKRSTLRAHVSFSPSLAYEISVGSAMPPPCPKGWDHVTYGPISSALGAAKVMKLTEAQVRQAINLAAVANIALRQTRVGDLSMWKGLRFHAARNGLFAAQLARLGMTGPSPIFEGGLHEELRCPGHSNYRGSVVGGPRRCLDPV